MEQCKHHSEYNFFCTVCGKDSDPTVGHHEKGRNEALKRGWEQKKRNPELRFLGDIIKQGEMFFDSLDIFLVLNNEVLIESAAGLSINYSPRTETLKQERLAERLAERIPHG